MSLNTLHLLNLLKRLLHQILVNRDLPHEVLGTARHGIEQRLDTVHAKRSICITVVEFLLSLLYVWLDVRFGCSFFVVGMKRPNAPPSCVYSSTVISAAAQFSEW